jgi:dihydrodipicolinate synthase/N-acetylneuraminate lyase
MANPKLISGGIIAAAVSPRRSGEQSIDLSASLELLDFLFDGGVNGIALLGSTGEFVHFVLEDRARMLDFAVKRSRLPILVNVSHSTLDGAISLGHEAIGSGVAAVLLMPPYYFRYGQEAIRAFYLKFAEAIAKEVPVYLYNIPVFTSPIALETALDLLATGAFAGIKDSGGNEAYLAGLLRDHRYHVFNGDDRVFRRARMAGADGAVSGTACAIPELMVAIDRAISAGDEARSQQLERYVHEFLGWFDKFPAPVIIKEAARQRKIKVGSHSTPLGEQATRDLAAFGGWFKEWLPGVLKQCH